MRLSKFFLMVAVSVFMLAIITAQSDDLPVCCKTKGGVEFCCKKGADINLPACCKAKGGAGKCCARGTQTTTIALNTETTMDAQTLPACCAMNANQKRSFWDKLFKRNKDPKSCCAKKN